MMIDIDCVGNVCVVRAKTTVSSKTPDDLLRLHTDPACASVFRDIGRYESFDVAENVIRASWKVRTFFGSSRMVVHKRVEHPSTIHFTTDDSSDISMEGSWTVEGPTVSILQKITVPSWVPRGIVRRIVRSKIENMFSDINK